MERHICLTWLFHEKIVLLLSKDGALLIKINNKKLENLTKLLLMLTSALDKRNNQIVFCTNLSLTSAWLFWAVLDFS